MTDDKRRCTNLECGIRISCARAYDEDYKDDPHHFGGRNTPVGCSAYVLRRGLGRDNPDLVFTESRRRGRRHNAHAYIGPRTEYPGAEALFGAKLTSALRGKSKVRIPGKLGISTRRPDLMVTRHIANGHNINEEND